MNTKILTFFLLSLPFLLLAQTPINDLKWAIQIQGWGEQFPALSIDGSDNSIITGHYRNLGANYIGFQGDTLIDYPNSTEDIILIKFDSNGDLVWAKSIMADKKLRLYTLKADTSDNLILYLGADSAFQVDNQVIPEGDLILKLDSNANYLWHLSLSGTSPGSSYSSGKKLELDENNDIFLTGHVGFVPTDSIIDTVIIFPDTFFVYQLEPDTLEIGNNIFPPSGQNNFFVTKIKTDATVLWTKQFTYNQNPNMTIMALDVNFKGIFLTGIVTGEWVIDNDTLNADTSNFTRSFLISLDGLGDIRWGKTYYWDVWTRDVSVSYTGDIYFSGYFIQQASFGNNTLYSPGVIDVILMKTDESGTLEWAKTIIDINDHEESYLTATKSGDVIVSRSVFAYAEPLMRKFDKNGIEEWALPISGDASSLNTALDYSDNLLMVGNYSTSTAVFGSVALYNQDPGFNVFLLKFENQDSIINTPVNVMVATGIQDGIKLFPNPTTNLLTINSMVPIKEVSLFNNLGIIQFVNQVKGNNVSISLEYMASGVYYIAVETNHKRFMKKIIKL